MVTIAPSFFPSLERYFKYLLEKRNNCLGIIVIDFYSGTGLTVLLRFAVGVFFYIDGRTFFM
jgi:hypothetical protein